VNPEKKTNIHVREREREREKKRERKKEREGGSVYKRRGER